LEVCERASQDAADANSGFGGSHTPIGYAQNMSDMEPGYLSDREAILKRLSRIEGQVRGVKGMVEDEAYCIDVLTQLGAISKALDGVGLRLLAEHTDHCVRGAVERGGAEADEKVDELMAAVERFARTR
jgi:CsoR family transcriptional regulator, copper-sensing transcriptional repressor